jgi:hypothetical protein
MNVSMPQSSVVTWLCLLFAPIFCLVIIYTTQNRQRQNTPQAAFPVVGHHNEWFFSVRAKAKSLWKTAAWASEVYVKVRSYDGVLVCAI